MRPSPFATLLRHVRDLAESDGDLLRRFVLRREEDAFATLVRRHANRVWGLCRRVLRHDADAEDAFQATFLTLVRRAASVRSGEALGGWLMQVARRIAGRAALERSRRRECEARVKTPLFETLETDGELRALVEEELHELPEKLRAPFVLCCLEGLTKGEAARRLGWKEGTVSGRLAEARRLLRSRLTRRGIVPVLAAAALPESLLTAATQLTTRGATISPRVAALAEGASTMGMLSKVKLAAAVLLVGAVCAGAAAIREDPTSRSVAQPPPAEKPTNKLPTEPPPPDPPKADGKPAPEDRLTEVLRRWHEAAMKVKTLTCDLTRTEVDSTFNTTKKFAGRVSFLSPNLFQLEMRKQGEPTEVERFVCDGKNLYGYYPDEKRIQAYSLMPPEDTPRLLRLFPDATVTMGSLIGGLDATEAKRRFDWKLVKEDQFYLYLEATPRTEQYRKEFLRMRLVLNKDTYLLRQLWMQQTESREVTWDVATIKTEVKMDRQDFTPKVPEGWRLDPVRRPGAKP
jgi:TIGR03009 family protein